MTHPQAPVIAIGERLVGVGLSHLDDVDMCDQVPGDAPGVGRVEGQASGRWAER
jgi:hypothetical protein